MCQRYFERWAFAAGSYGYVGGGVGMAWGAGQARIQLQYLVPKRAAPSCSATGTLAWGDSVNNFTQTSFSFDGPTTNSVLLYGTVSGTTTAANAMQAYVNGTDPFSVSFSAEL